MKVSYFQQQGQRDYQEDFFYQDISTQLFIVCDGVGGAAKGEVASKEVTMAIANQINSGFRLTDKDSVQDLINQVQAHLSARLADHPMELGAASTLVLLTFYQGKALLIHIGDSRIYHVRPGGDYHWRTKDHSYVQELFDSNIIRTEEEMRHHPKRNQITKALISEFRIKPVHASIKEITDLEAGDIFVLCSDGVLEPFTNEAFLKILQDKSLDLMEKKEQIREACSGESRDNNTAIFVQLEANDLSE